MECTRRLTDDLIFVGGSDRRLALFENVYPIPSGMSYNSYLLLDEQTVLFDTVDHSISGRFFENLEAGLNGRTLDFVIVQHMEPDHSASLEELLRRYPDMTVVCNAKTLAMMKQFFPAWAHPEDRAYVVKEGDILTSGRHTLTFVLAPMVHWPEVMFTYDTTDHILFTADAFGSFGALDGGVFADEANVLACDSYVSEMRRYYTNIVGKYGPQVQAVLKKAASLDIRMICPLHGYVWRENIDRLIEKYDLWSRYVPEEKGVLIVYGSIYGGTENAAEALACALERVGITRVRMYDVSVTHSSYILAEAFRYSHIVLASSTYNGGIFVNMENFLHDLEAHNLKNRTIALMENGTWAPQAGKLMRELVGGMKNMTVLEETLTIRSVLQPSQKESIEHMADILASDLKATEEATAPVPASGASAASALSASDAGAGKNPQVESGALHKLSYGLFVLSTRTDDKDNACIVNTVLQLTSSPLQISVAVNKANYTCEMIQKSGVFNVSVLTETAPFDVFRRYGFQSGRDSDKFAGETGLARSANGVFYLTEHTNAFFACRVVSTVDCGSHLLFIAEVDEASVLSKEPSVTYDYYFAHIKPKPEKPKKAETGKKRWVCKICGYVYEGDTLPDDFVCPICKHGVADFELMED